MLLCGFPPMDLAGDIARSPCPMKRFADSSVHATRANNIRLGFELGRLRILRAIEKFVTLSYEGQRFTLSADEL